ncbi:hypothetical protein ACLQ2T_15420 [Micromonospora sp. DT229]
MGRSRADLRAASLATGATDRTLVTIAEEGRRPTPQGQRASYGTCEGWTNMLCCLKAWLEHGIELRTGFYA